MKQGLKINSGGIVGRRNGYTDRAGLLLGLANLPTPPEAVAINMLVVSAPAADKPMTRGCVLILFIILLSRSAHHDADTHTCVLSAGREQMNEQTRAILAWPGGRDSIYSMAAKLLTTPNPAGRDLQLFRSWGWIPPANPRGAGGR